MNTKKVYLSVILSVLALGVLLAVPLSVSASHAWNNYHWARTSNPFTIKVVDSMTTDWDNNLDDAITDWNQSIVMNVVKEAGNDAARVRKRCAATSGMVHTCNAAYGNNGWLGVAQIWVKGDHIIKGTAKMNDTYLATPSYNETNRQHVICQEIGHDWGLAHQDESGADLNTCMDYAFALDNPHPNSHDYEQLEFMYAHLDSTTTLGSIPAGFDRADVNAQENWGELASQDPGGRSALYMRDFGNGYKIFTFVTWAVE